MNTYYLGIDLNLPQDIKIIKLKRKLGFSGFGLYIELQLKLAQSKDYELSKNDYADLAYEFRLEEKYIKELVEDFDLFEFKNDKFFIQEIKTKMKLLQDKKKMASEAGKKGNAIRWGKASGTDSHPTPEPNRNKVNKVNKVNESKEKEKLITDFFNQNLKELIETNLIPYQNQTWFTEQAAVSTQDLKEKMLDYYLEGGGKKKEIKNIKSTFLNWLKKCDRKDFYQYNKDQITHSKTSADIEAENNNLVIKRSEYGNDDLGIRFAVDQAKIANPNIKIQIID
ncbi:MAG: Lin1244/Lin1753 domain-containing protein [Fusobacteriaceae bacterium]